MGPPVRDEVYAVINNPTLPGVGLLANGLLYATRLSWNEVPGPVALRPHLPMSLPILFQPYYIKIGAEGE
jgi:hypothetical protein